MNRANTLAFNEVSFIKSALPQGRRSRSAHVHKQPAARGYHARKGEEGCWGSFPVFY
jgi:hypothetical protein